MAPLLPTDISGQRLLSVTVAWHVFKGVRGNEPVHLWLELDGSGYVRCHTAGSGDLMLTVERPYEPYDMEEYGHIALVAGEPASLADHVGEVVGPVTPVYESALGFRLGVVLQFASGAVAITNLGDELVVGPWPEAFETAGVHVAIER